MVLEQAEEERARRVAHDAKGDFSLAQRCSDMIVIQVNQVPCTNEGPHCCIGDSISDDVQRNWMMLHVSQRTQVVAFDAG